MPEQRNFSPGDVVVRVLPAPESGFVRGRLYTVREAWICPFHHEPCILVVEHPDPTCAHQRDYEREFPGWRLGYSSEAFRLAYRPDPEVERERTDEPKRIGEDA